MLPYYVEKLQQVKPAIVLNHTPLSSTDKVDVYIQAVDEPEIVVIDYKSRFKLQELPTIARPLIGYYLTTSVLEPSWRESFDQAMTSMFSEIHGMMTTWGEVYGESYDYVISLMGTDITFYLRVERKGDGDEFSFHMAVCTGKKSKELYFVADISEMNYLSKEPMRP